MSKATNSAPKGAKAPKTAKVKAVRDPNVSFADFLALRATARGGVKINSAGVANRLTKNGLVQITEKAETVLARETKSAIFYKKVVTRNASLTAKGQALLDKLNASLEA
jgi:hypothetical protein